jgi:cephalosporin hydroxylase
VRLVIDTQQQTLVVEDGSVRATHDLYSPQAFAIISRQWLRLGWTQKYSYGFAWLGRPVIQLPEDLLRIQEAIYQLEPDVLIQTGVAHGGLLVFCASVCQALGRGRVIGIDVDIRPDESLPDTRRRRLDRS